MHKAANNSLPLRAPTLFSVCDGCYNGICSVSILPNGDVYPCRRLPIKVGNLLTESFEDILHANSSCASCACGCVGFQSCPAFLF